MIGYACRQRLMMWHCMTVGDHAAECVIGQPEFVSEGRHREGLPRVATSDLPASLTQCGDALVIADSGNNRVMIWKLTP